ncbi:alpha/beta-hydrolase family protein [Actinotalea sp. Marseille-Q4924]|uniref:alpha/beta-hydrolase family protein n=1 Tax=Actinotalea sp. Marseille-Q4924 TaxID=2866571 RepID=UPI001CE48495|nr:alpha/beta-hydrolase family protein [Actinotalea sp. Marseille-Q4924]
MKRGVLYARLSASQRAGVVAAAASVPAGLVPLLRPRSALDQGLVTGLSAAAGYALTTVEHDVVLVLSRGLRRVAGRRTDTPGTARTTLAVDLMTVMVTSAVHAVLPRRDDESTLRALIGTGVVRARSAALAGALAGALDAVPVGGPGTAGAVVSRALHTVPAVVLAGGGAATVVEALRLRRARRAGLELGRDRDAPVMTSLAWGGAVATGAVGVAAAERQVARAVDRLLDGVTGPSRHGQVVSHLASLTVIAVVLAALGAEVGRRAETAVSLPDVALGEPPTSARVSGGPGSPVRWETLTREARRHLASASTVESLRAVMGGEVQEPIRVYVGLRSAPTVERRVALAVAELERTGALDRSLLVLCSPTGAGYIHYAAAAAWEHLTRGDCASLTVQYGARPSLLSLRRVGAAREQNRAVWTAVAALLARRAPADRPRVVTFGESLGALTGQDVFRHTGTQGLRALGIDRALWLGTPLPSIWARETAGPARPDVGPGEVLRLTAVAEIDALDPVAAAAARYVLLSHDDDAVALFAPQALYRRPSCLGEHRPPAIPSQAEWSTPITFLQAVVDLKNAMKPVPGRSGGGGHDYRPDIARAVCFAFGLPCTPAELAAVTEASAQEELGRTSRWSRPPAGGVHRPARLPGLPVSARPRASARDGREKGVPRDRAEPYGRSAGPVGLDHRPDRGEVPS